MRSLYTAILENNEYNLLKCLRNLDTDMVKFKKIIHGEKRLLKSKKEARPLIQEEIKQINKIISDFSSLMRECYDLDTMVILIQQRNQELLSIANANLTTDCNFLLNTEAMLAHVWESLQTMNHGTYHFQKPKPPFH